jgi:hypothetical protein
LILSERNWAVRAPDLAKALKAVSVGCSTIEESAVGIIGSRKNLVELQRKSQGLKVEPLAAADSRCRPRKPPRFARSSECRKGL